MFLSPQSCMYFDDFDIRSLWEDKKGLQISEVKGTVCGVVCANRPYLQPSNHLIAPASVPFPSTYQPCDHSRTDDNDLSCSIILNSFDSFQPASLFLNCWLRLRLRGNCNGLFRNFNDKAAGRVYPDFVFFASSFFYRRAYFINKDSHAMPWRRKKKETERVGKAARSRAVKAVAPCQHVVGRQPVAPSRAAALLVNTGLLLGGPWQMRALALLWRRDPRWCWRMHAVWKQYCYHSKSGSIDRHIPLSVVTLTCQLIEKNI